MLCTGNGGIGSGLVAAATASVAAQAGVKTVLASFGPSHSVGALLGLPLSSTLQAVAPHLDAWVLDAPAELSAWLERLRPQLTGPLAQMSGDELPLLLGLDFFLGMARLQRMATDGYRLAVVDVGSHDALLRVLSLPDSFRWFIRLMFGLDRGPGRNPASVGRAVVPTSLLPFDWLGQVQEARVAFEQAREAATAAGQMTVRYVLRPDMAALAETRLALPALHLHGLAVDAVVVGPLLPPDITDDRLTVMAGQQAAVADAAAQVWPALPLLRMALAHVPESVAEVTVLGELLYREHRLADLDGAAAPMQQGDREHPSLAIHVPGVQREALHLTLSGDELIVRIGPYRRHVLLPDTLRGKGNIRASRDGEWLIVRLRQ